MGTSTSNQGQSGRTPLVPSWLDDENNNDNNTIPAQADSERFRVPRGDFTRYVNSGGRDSGNLHKSVSQYIKQSLGGAKNATSRLGASRTSTARLMSVVSSIAGRGIAETSKVFGLGDLMGKNASDVFLEIMDFVCPDGGSTDEGIARSSYIETIESMPELSVTPIENMTEQQFLIFTETYMSNVIQERLLNDIGNKTISLPDDIGTVQMIQEQLGGYIHGAVSDAITQLNVEIRNIDSTQTRAIVDSVYEKSYTILESLSEV
ncbi:MAG: Qat anti-phage system associated protein QatB [Thermotaleaceae bacterium]